MGDGELEDQQYSRGATPVLLTNLAGYELRLHHGGKQLTDVADDGFPDQLWLTPGNYFIEARSGRTSTFFPVPLTGYRCGPDKDGAFIITVRSVPQIQPPASVWSDFCFIPSGWFLLGDRLNPREPHYVWLTSFFMGRFEVTNLEFRKFMKATDGYDDEVNWTEAGRRWRSSVKSRSSALLEQRDADYTRFGLPDQPLTWVTWYEAHAYCRWLTRRAVDGRWLYALPKDAEWEKAARGPDNLDYGLSMNISDAEVELYNWRRNLMDSVTVIGVGATRDSYRPNRYGLYHMTGNAIEWTQSVHRPFNREHPYTDDDRNHDETPGPRVARGGSWYSASNAYLYTPYREAFQPEHCSQETGFRIVVRPLP
jgi:formylglycine-generating enzyme required for sulfatase activity